MSVVGKYKYTNYGKHIMSANNVEKCICVEKVSFGFVPAVWNGDTRASLSADCQVKGTHTHGRTHTHGVYILSSHTGIDSSNIKR